MNTQLVLPYPLVRMFEYLDIDHERGLKLLPEAMADGIEACLACDMSEMCDFNSEVRYFRCPNRELLDRLEDLLQ